MCSRFATLPLLALTLVVLPCAASPTTSEERSTLARHEANNVSATDARPRPQAAIGAVTATGDTEITPDELMDWAERAYQQYFPDHQSSRTDTFLGVVYVYRCYSNGNCLGVDGKGDIKGMGPYTGGVLAAFGALTSYTCDVRPESCLPPKVLSTVPAANDTNVPYRGVQITITFSKALRCPDRNSGISLGTIEGRVISCDENVIVIQPTDGWLPSGTVVELALDSLQDQAGRGMQPYSWRVSTAQPAQTEINDTGLVLCVGPESQVICSDSRAYPGQDALVGRDWENQRGILRRSGVSDSGFDFTKLGRNGFVLHNDATEWDCVRDNVTGLIWEVKTNNGDFRHQFWTYSWYQPDETLNGGHPGYEIDQDGINWCGNTLTKCNTKNYTDAINAQRLCGFSDWRLPTAIELFDIVSFDGTWNSHGPEGVAFKTIPIRANGLGENYWTATPTPFPSVSRGIGATAIYLGIGSYPGSGFKDTSAAIRLVRGGAPVAGPRGILPDTVLQTGNQRCHSVIPRTAPDLRYEFRDDGTVLDRETRLVWKRCAEGKGGVSCAGAADKLTYVQALAAATSSRFAGHADWRVPNIKELMSLAEWACGYPAMNVKAFPNAIDTSVGALREYLISSTTEQVWNGTTFETRIIAAVLGDFFPFTQNLAFRGYLAGSAPLLLVRGP